MYGQNADPDNGSYFGCTSEFPRNIFKNNNNNNNTGPSSKKFKLNWSGMKLNSQYFFLKLLRYFLMCHQMGKGSPYGKSSSKSNSIYYFPPPLTFCCSPVWTLLFLLNVLFQSAASASSQSPRLGVPGVIFESTLFLIPTPSTGRTCHRPIPS